MMAQGKPSYGTCNPTHAGNIIYCKFSKFIYTVYMVVGGMISRGFNMGLSCSIYVPAFYCSSLGVSQHWVPQKVVGLFYP
jgi:hypothetical protein